MKSLNKINDIFNVDTDIESSPSLPALPIDASVSKEDDFELARQTLRNLINKNEDVMTELVHIAKNSEHPRAFEVVGKLVEAQTNIAKELVGLHKVKNDIDGDGAAKSEKIQTQNNIVFAGSTADLMKLISSQKAKIIDTN